jgi:hypothetical protein
MPGRIFDLLDREAVRPEDLGESQPIGRTAPDDLEAISRF